MTRIPDLLHWRSPANHGVNARLVASTGPGLTSPGAERPAV